MQCPLCTGWKTIAVVGVLAVVGTLFVCRLMPGCLLGPAEGARSSARGDLIDQDAVSAELPVSGEIEYVDESTFEQKVLGSDVPVLVDFYADWCVPCRMLAPTLEELAEELSDAKIVKVNIDQNPRLAARYGIDALPSLLVFDEGEIRGGHVGLAGKDELREMVRP